MKTEIKCIYCNESLANTLDHIPPKCIYSRPFPKNILTVPCCSKCNSRFALDDEYFMIFLTLIENTSSNIYKEKLFEKLQRMKLREENRKLIEYIKRSFEAKAVITDSGIILLNQPGININQQRIHYTIDRIIKGLVYKETGLLTREIISIFSTDYKNLSHDMIIQLFDVLELLKNGDLHYIGDGKVFGYKCLFPKSCPELSSWILCFFESFYIIALAVHTNFTGVFHPSNSHI